MRSAWLGGGLQEEPLSHPEHWHRKTQGLCQSKHLKRVRAALQMGCAALLPHPAPSRPPRKSGPGTLPTSPAPGKGSNAACSWDALRHTSAPSAMAAQSAHALCPGVWCSAGTAPGTERLCQEQPFPSAEQSLLYSCHQPTRSQDIFRAARADELCIRTMGCLSQPSTGCSFRGGQRGCWARMLGGRGCAACHSTTCLALSLLAAAFVQELAGAHGERT